MGTISWSRSISMRSAGFTSSTWSAPSPLVKTVISPYSLIETPGLPPDDVS